MIDVSAVTTRLKLVSTTRYLPAQPSPPTLAPSSDTPGERRLAHTILKAFPVLEDNQWRVGALPLAAPAADAYAQNGGADQVVVDTSARSIADFALTTASALMEGLERKSSIDYLIYTHASLPMDFDVSGACFLKFSLGLDDAIPFSIGQAHSASFLFALRVAADLDAPGNIRAATSIITTSDRWVAPLPRIVAPFAAAGDAATASYVCDLSDPIEGWPVLAIANSTLGSLADPLETGANPDAVLETMADAVNRAVEAVLEIAGLHISEVRWIIPQAINHILCGRVAAALKDSKATCFVIHRRGMDSCPPQTRHSPYRCFPNAQNLNPETWFSSGRSAQEDLFQPPS